MKINSFCLTCLINMQESQVRKFDDEEKKMAYMREVLAFLSSCDPDLSAPALVKPLSRIYEKYWGKRDSMEEVKQEFNDYLLSMEEELEAKAYSPDSEPLKYKLYNLFYDAKGSHKYQGEWNQLDHIIVNGALLQENQALHVQKDSYQVFSPSFLLIPDKTWRGVRPFRTYYGFKYEGGYSDHLPLVVTFEWNKM